MSKKLSATEFKLHLISLLSDSAAPNSGGGLAAVIGSWFSKDAAPTGLFLKTTAPDLGWTEYTASFNWYSVRDYGAVGDGVTDDRVPIANAIAACQAAGGGCVYFPRGTYVCSKDGANPYSFDLNGTSSMTLLGQGARSILVQTGNAGASAWDLFRLRGGAQMIRFEMLAFSGAGLTNPAASRANHLVRIGDGASAVTSVQMLRCQFGSMVAGAGDGLHMGGAAGTLVSRVWALDCVFDGCARYGIGGEQGLEHIIIGENYLTNCETEIAFVSTGAGNSNSIVVASNEIVHTSATERHAVRFVGHDTDLITRLTVQANTIVGGFAELANARYVSWAGTTQTSGVYASTDAAMRLYRRLSDVVYAGNVVIRATGAGNGPTVSLEETDGVQPTRTRIGASVFINEVTGQPCALLESCTACSFGDNDLRSSDAGASAAYAIDVQAVGGTVDATIVQGNVISAAAGTWGAAIRYLTNGADMANTMASGNLGSATAYGIRYEDAGVGAFTGRQMASGNTFDSTTGDYEQVGVSFPVYIGGNAGPTGTQVITGTGTPEGVVTAPVGSIFLRRDGATDAAFYYKETGAGNTGWRGAAASQVIVFGAGATGNTAATTFLAPGYITTISATEIQMTATRPGIVQDLRVRVATAGTDSSNITVTVRRNGVDTALTVTFDNAASGDFGDLVNSFTVAASDEISVSFTRAGAVTAGQANVIVTMELV